MNRKIYAIILGLLLYTGSAAWGAQPNSSQIRSANNEMRKSVVWLMEGLLELSRSKDKNLLLQPAQKKKILPVFNALVSKKILVLKIAPNQYNNQGQRGNMDPNDPKIQERTKALQEQTAFGNQQADLIDGILNRKQVAFIDNLNFKAEKYGIRDLQNGSQSGGQGQGQLQRDPQLMTKARQQMRTGREIQVKLCQNVAKMLKAN